MSNEVCKISVQIIIEPIGEGIAVHHNNGYIQDLSEEKMEASKKALYEGVQRDLTVALANYDAHAKPRREMYGTATDHRTT